MSLLSSMVHPIPSLSWTSSNSKSKGVWLEYLPPYSPNLNPIKEAILQIKSWIHCKLDVFLAVEGDGLFYNMWKALDIVTADDAQGYI